MRHNRVVQAYFRDRPGQLLVMDFAKGDGRETLCRVLGLPVPPIEFPRVKPLEPRRKM